MKDKDVILSGMQRKIREQAKVIRNLQHADRFKIIFQRGSYTCEECAFLSREARQAGCCDLFGVIFTDGITPETFVCAAFSPTKIEAMQPAKDWALTAAFCHGFEYALNCWEHLTCIKKYSKTHYDVRWKLRRFLTDMLLEYWPKNHIPWLKDFPEIENCIFIKGNRITHWKKLKSEVKE